MTLIVDIKQRLQKMFAHERHTLAEQQVFQHGDALTWVLFETVFGKL